MNDEIKDEVFNTGGTLYLNDTHSLKINKQANDYLLNFSWGSGWDSVIITEKKRQELILYIEREGK